MRKRSQIEREQQQLGFVRAFGGSAVQLPLPRGRVFPQAPRRVLGNYTMKGTTMGIGVGIALLVVGAILSFAVRDNVPGVDLSMVGYICMGAGVLALVLSLVLNAQATRTKHTAVVEHRDDVA